MKHNHTCTLLLLKNIDNNVKFLCKKHQGTNSRSFFMPQSKESEISLNHVYLKI